MFRFQKIDTKHKCQSRQCVHCFIRGNLSLKISNSHSFMVWIERFTKMIHRKSWISYDKIDTSQPILIFDCENIMNVTNAALFFQAGESHRLTRTGQGKPCAVPWMIKLSSIFPAWTNYILRESNSFAAIKYRSPPVSRLLCVTIFCELRSDRGEMARVEQEGGGGGVGERGRSLAKFWRAVCEN